MMAKQMVLRLNCNKCIDIPNFLKAANDMLCRKSKLQLRRLPQPYAKQTAKTNYTSSQTKSYGHLAL